MVCEEFGVGPCGRTVDLGVRPCSGAQDGWMGWICVPRVTNLFVFVGLLFISSVWIAATHRLLPVTPRGSTLLLAAYSRFGGALPITLTATMTNLFPVPTIQCTVWMASAQWSRVIMVRKGAARDLFCGFSVIPHGTLGHFSSRPNSNTD